MPQNNPLEFALSFTADAVHLRQRNMTVDLENRWHSLGEVDFASPDFRAELAALRARAHDEGPDDDLPVLLLIPQEQILYTSLSVPAGPQRDLAVGQALDGLTPYAIDELSFDWVEEDGDVRVAAVARQTLIEALEFAQRHGFSGAGFSATPQEDDYPDEPVFRLYDADPEVIEVTDQDDPLDPLPPRQDIATEAEAADGLDVLADPALQSDEALSPDQDQPEAGFTERAAPDPDSDTGTASDDILDEFPAPQTLADSFLAELPDEQGFSDPQLSMILAGVNGDDIKADMPEDEADPALQTAHPPLSTQDQSVAQGGDPKLASDTPGLAAAGLVGAELVNNADRPTDESVPPPPPDAARQADLPAPETKPAVTLAKQPATPPLMAGKATTKTPKTPAAPKIVADVAPTVVRHSTPAVGAAAPLAAGPISASAQGRKLAGQRGGLVELVAMLGALIVGLLLIWAFFVPRDNPAQVAGQDIAMAETATPLTENLQNSAPPEQTAEAANQIKPEAAPVTDTDVATQAIASTDTATALIEAPSEQPSDKIDALPAAPLTEIERALVIAAATAPVEVIAETPLPRPDNVVQAADPVMDGGAEDAAEKERIAEVEAEKARAVEAEAAAGAAIEAGQQAQIAATQPATETLAQTPEAVQPSSRLTSSARPVSAPRRTSAAPKVDTPPAIPSNPLPFEAAQRPVVTPAGTRPPNRPAASRPTQATMPVAAAPVSTPATAPIVTQPVVSNLRSSSRPPSRPEGSAPDMLDDQPLSVDEQRDIQRMLKDFHQKTALLPDPRGRHAGLTAQDQPYRLAELRPSRRPASVEARARQGGTTSDAVENAVRAASETGPPDRPAVPPSSASASTMPARNSGGLLNVSARPSARPGTNGDATASGVDAALSEAVSSAAALPSALPGGGVALTALTSSRVPPRRTGGGGGGAETVALTASPSRNDEAEQAERRRLDEQLQSQAEARIRARAAADAAAEASARAQAEARARAQVAAEESAAASRKQAYKPQEVDDEPEVAQAVARGPTAATVASAATERRGLNMGRTTIIGIIGAGQASRALVRLRNGKIVTLRLGDKIDGGTVTSIGNGKVIYAKAGRQHELQLLDGR